MLLFRSMDLKSIQLKIALWSGLCLLLATAVITTYAATSLRNTAIHAAEVQSIGVAEAHANKIDAEIEEALNVARTLALTLKATQDPANPVRLSREEVNTILKQVLLDHPKLLAT